MPNERPRYNEALASGIAYRSTAGTTMYEALAESTISTAASPTGKRSSADSNNAIAGYTML